MPVATHPLVIVGGGIHGTIISLALARYLPPTYHRVIDPHLRPLEVWQRNCRACGLQYLRSPGAHQLSSDPHALLRFSRAAAAQSVIAALAARSSGAVPPPFIPRYNRPLFSLFMRHASDLIQQHRLERFRERATCQRVVLRENGVVMETDKGEVHAERALLCVGVTSHPVIPAWAARHQFPHVFSERFRIADHRRQRRVVIIGGGITALQLALAIAGDDGDNGGAVREITVLSRHELRYADFDSDPCYLGPRCLREFTQLRDPTDKWELITQARNRASIPPDIAERFRRQCREGGGGGNGGGGNGGGGNGGGGARCRVLIGEVRRVERAAAESRLQLTDGRCLAADTVILATGFAEAPLASPLLADLQRRYQLPCSAAGFPVTDAQLRWHPRVMLSGASAALTVGPAAGNIIGAHLALRRLLPLLLARPYREDYAWTALQKIIPDYQ